MNPAIKLSILFLVPLIASAIEIKNARELLHSMSLITNTSTKNKLVSKKYETVKESLPRRGHLNELTGSSVLASFNLAYSFCSETLSNERELTQEKRVLYRGLPIEKAYINWSSAYKSSLLSELAKQIFSRDLTHSEMISMQAFMENFKDGALTLNSICASMFSLPSFLIKDLK